MRKGLSRTRRISRRAFQIAAGSGLLRTLLAQTPTEGERGVAPPGSPDSANRSPSRLDALNARRRVALVIGNNAYKSAPVLHNAVNDAEDLGAKLTQLGFGVTRLRDSGADATRGAIASFTSRLGTGDIALFFYSGHGIQAGGDNYIVPIDFDPASGESHLPVSCIRASAVQDAMEKSGSQLNIVILDACRNNPFRPGAAVKGMALMEAGLGTCIALATGPGQTASDNSSERNGLFSKYLLQEIDYAEQSLDQILKTVKEQVFRESGGRQRPWTFADVIGDFFFGADAASYRASDRAQGYIEAGKRLFQAGQFEEAAQSFDRALRVDPENPFACNALGTARARLRQWSIAVGFYSRAIEIKPDYGAAYFNRGVAYFNAARYELAAVDFSWAIDEEPYDPRALDLRGKTYLSLRDHEQALADFNRALVLDPYNSAALAGRGEVWFRQGHYADAIRDLSASLSLRPTADVYDSRSQAYRALHQTAQADADSRKAEQIRSGR